MADEEHFELGSVDYPRRGAMRGRHGCVAADHPLAAQAGMDVIRRGGVAADAAVAMGAVMVVVQPHYSHLGGDLHALAFDGGPAGIASVLASGPAPRGLDIDRYRSLGGIPRQGPLSVTVPGVVDGWWKLHHGRGRLPWRVLFEHAIELAAGGFPASRRLAAALRLGRGMVEPWAPFEDVFGPGFRAGGSVRQPALAQTLAAIAEAGPAGFYEGDVARAVLARLNADGAVFTASEWTGPARLEAPISVPFAGATVHTQSPPTHGFVLAIALGLFELLRGQEPEAPAPLLQHRAVALAYDVRARHGGDPDFTGFDPGRFLEPGQLDLLARGDPGTGAARGGDTTFLLAVDAEGNAVSHIQSIFAPWGSGVFVPAAGVLMNNRLVGFSLHRDSPNVLAPGKRPLHTLHSYLVTSAGGALRAVGGAPGGFVQPQTNLQVLTSLLAGGLDPQDALDEPRWCIAGLGPSGLGIHRERREPDHLGEVFRAAGIPVVPFGERAYEPAWEGRMGRAYLASIEGGTVAVAADLRGEGQALAW